MNPSTIFYVSFTTQNGERIAAGPMTAEVARSLCWRLNQCTDITDRNIVTSFPDCMKPDHIISCSRLVGWIHSAMASS